MHDFGILKITGLLQAIVFHLTMIWNLW